MIGLGLSLPMPMLAPGGGGGAVVPVIEVDGWVNLTAPADGTVVTGAIMDAAEEGDILGDGAWQTETADGANPIPNCKVRDLAEPFVPFCALKLGSTTLREFSKVIEFDCTGRTLNDELFEILRRAAIPAGRSLWNAVIFFQIDLGPDPLGAQNTSVDVIDIGAGIQGIMQFGMNQVGGDRNVHTHGDGIGGFVPVERAPWYMAFHQTDAAGNKVRFVILNASTGAEAGNSELAGAYEAVTSLAVTSYLNLYDDGVAAKIRIGGRIGWQTATQIPEMTPAFVPAAVTDLAAAQLVAGAVYFNWSGPGLAGANTCERYKVELSTDAGDFEELEAAQVPRFINVAELDDGAELVLRVTRLVNGHAALPATVAITVNNANACPIPADALDAAIDLRAQNFAAEQLMPQIDDISGNGNHFLAAGTAQQPIFKTGGLNGKPFARFNSSQDIMTMVLGARSAWAAILITNTNAAFGGVVLAKGGNVQIYTGASTFQWWNPDTAFPVTKGSPRLLIVNVASAASATLYGGNTTGSTIDPHDEATSATTWELNGIGGGQLAGQDFYALYLANRALTGGELTALQAWANAAANWQGVI